MAATMMRNARVTAVAGRTNGNNSSVEPAPAGSPRKLVRAVLVTPARVDAMRWLDVVRDDLSLDVRCIATMSQALDVVLAREVDIAIVGETLDDGSYRDLLPMLRLARRDLPV